MNDIKCAFVTGGTGLLGVNIVKELIQNTSAKIILLVRNATGKKRDKFFTDLLAFNGGLWPVGFSFERIRFVEGDVARPGLGITSRVRTQLYREIDIIYHSAAVIKLSGAEDEVQSVNVQGTRNVLEFALACQEKGRLDRVVHISTIAVSGDREGVVYEDELDCGQGFNNPYEKSKFDAEKIVGEYREKGLNILILRPSMVVGHSRTGFTNHYNIFYFQLRLLSQGVLDVLPLREDATYNLIPVDYAARACFLIAHSPHARNGNYHIVNSHEVDVRQFIETACGYLGYPKPTLMRLCESTLMQPSMLTGVRGRVLGIYYPYIVHKKAFESSKAIEILHGNGFTWPKIDSQMLTNTLDHCVLTGYLHLRSVPADSELYRGDTAFKKR